jgi:hypothetical protein
VSVTEDLDVIEKSIKLLQVEWEKFFGGVEKKPPVDLRTRLEKLFKGYSNAELRGAERFRYQTLTARYHTFNELWNKRMRAVEEGVPLGLHGVQLARALAVAPPPPPPPAARSAAAAGARAGGAGAGEVRVTDASDTQAVKTLFDRFLKARQEAGETAPVKFESFQKVITQQAARMLADKGAQAVDFRLETKDGKVSLKAKPVK